MSRPAKVLCGIVGDVHGRCPDLRILALLCDGEDEHGARAADRLGATRVLAGQFDSRRMVDSVGRLLSD